MSSQKSINRTFDALEDLIESHAATFAGWSPDFCKQAKKDLREIQAIMKQVNYYGGIASLLDYAKRGASTMPLFNDVEENSKP